MVEKTTTAEAAPAPKKRERDFDWMSAISFGAVSLLGVGTVINKVHQAFDRKFVKSTGGELTAFDTLNEEYHSKKHVSGPEQYKGKFAQNVARFENKEIDGAAFMRNRNALDKEYKEKVATILEDEFKIASKNPLKALTVGTWQRWQKIGLHFQSDAALGFATVTALGLGAVAVLKHGKDTVDRIEDKFDALRDSVNQSR